MKEISGQFEFDSKDKIYKDHFPGNPIVPGTLIVRSFIRVLSKHFSKADFEIQKFRFKKFLKPARYDYSIVISNRTAKCAIIHNNKQLVSGKVKWN